MRRALLVIAGLLILGMAWLAISPPELNFTAQAWQPSSGPTPSGPLLERQPCADYSKKRAAFFGDLHIHTSLSMDARSRDMLTNPDQAYQFARGERIGFGPFIDGKATRRGQIQRPLDFAAVTDHAEWIGEVTMCTHPKSPRYQAHACQVYRGEAESTSLIGNIMGGRFMALMGFGGRNAEICGEDGQDCRAPLKTAWELTQQASERYYDRSEDCEFTTFHGWEYSDSVMMSKVHRNVIFRNEKVPELPISSQEDKTPLGFWEELDEKCNQTGTGCEALTIPHNPNVSNGRMFTVPYRNETLEEQRRQASLRQRMEPLVEMMQIKGESECRDGLWQVAGADDFCGFEKIRLMSGTTPQACQDDTGSGALRGAGCQSRLDFARYAMIEGMREQDRIGVNP